MSGSAGILGTVCGGFCLVIGSTSNSLCSLRPFGFHRTCCSDRGYYGCCCRDSFDEEHFDKQMQKEMERTRDKTVYTLVRPHAVETEPESTSGMTVERSSRRGVESEYDVDSDDHVEVGPS